MASRFRWSHTTACTAVLVGLVAGHGGCSSSSRESGDVVGATGGNAGQPVEVGAGGQETIDGAGGAGIGGGVTGAGGATPIAGATSGGGPVTSGGAPGVGGAIIWVGGAPGHGGVSGSAGTTEISGSAGVAGEIPAGGASSGVGGDAGNAGDNGSGGDNVLGGQAGTAGSTGSGGSSTGGSDSGCVPAPGPCTETTSYPVSGPSERTTYFYNDLGQLVRTETDDEPPVIMLYTYDDAGRLAEVINDDCDRTGESRNCIWTVYTYDVQGNLVLEDVRTDLAPPHYLVTLQPHCYVHTYDENGLQLTTTHYEPCRGSVASYYTYEYDAAGQLVTWTVEDEDGNIIHIRRYTRNAAGQPLVIVHEYPSSNDFQVTYTYDEQGNEVEWRALGLRGTYEGQEYSCGIKTHDDCGNLLTEEFASPCDSEVDRTLIYTYECFDQ